MNLESVLRKVGTGMWTGLGFGELKSVSVRIHRKPLIQYFQKLIIKKDNISDSNLGNVNSLYRKSNIN